jgi:hypothetical protein
MLYVRDNRIITPWLKDGAPTAGRLEALAMSGASGYFTEPIDVGTFIEGIIMFNLSSKTGTAPTLDCDLQYGYQDDKGNFHFVDSGDSITQMTDNGMSIKKVTNFGKWIRFRVKIGGTGTPGYTVSMKFIVKG